VVPGEKSSVSTGVTGSITLSIGLKPSSLTVFLLQETLNINRKIIEKIILIYVPVIELVYHYIG
jgi:hypothetical protein